MFNKICHKSAELLFCDHSVHNTFRQTSNIKRTKSKYLNVSRLILHKSLPNPLKPGGYVEKEYVVGAAPTGDVSTTFEWSTIVLPSKVCLMLEVWRYMYTYVCTMHTDIHTCVLGWQANFTHSVIFLNSSNPHAHVSHLVSRLYFTGVTAAQLHCQSNMNVMQII